MLITNTLCWWYTILIAGGENKEITKVVSKIKRKYKVSTDKSAKKIIGINIVKIKNKGYKINQKDYIKKKKKKC